MSPLQRAVYTGFLIALILIGLYIARPFLVPLAFALVLALLFVDLSTKLERRGLSRGVASLVCVLVFIVTVGFIMALLYWQFTKFSGDVEQIRKRMEAILQEIRQWINQTFGLSNNEQKELLKGQTQGENTVAIDFVRHFFSFIVNTVLMLVYFYLFLYQRTRIKKFILAQAALNHQVRATVILKDSSTVVRRYLFGLAKMIGMLWILYGIGFSIIGVEGALFFAVLCGVLEIIPFVGNITGTSITIIAVLAQGGDALMVVAVGATYLFVQFIQSYFLEPLVVGEEVNINPLFTIMAIVLGELLWGIAGMFLAIPFLGLIKVVCDRIPLLQPYGYLIGTDRRKKRRST